MPALLITLGILVVLALIVVGIYNGLVKLRNHTDEAWSGIQTELKRRYDLIPNLVETVRGFAKHESGVLTAVTEARSRAAGSHGSPAEQARDENALIGAMRQMFAVAENYPDLKANTNFLDLQKQLAATEDRLQTARRFYNANVRDLNMKIQQFPSNIVAGMFKFTSREFFELDEETAKAAAQAPKVSF